MRKIGLAHLGVARKGNPCPSMSMLWATKHTLRQCGGLECTSNLTKFGSHSSRAQRVTFDPAQKRSRECIRGSESSVKVNGSALAPALAMSRCRMLLVAENKRREGSHHLPPVGMPS